MTEERSQSEGQGTLKTALMKENRENQWRGGREGRLKERAGVDLSIKKQQRKKISRPRTLKNDVSLWLMVGARKPLNTTGGERKQGAYIRKSWDCGRFIKKGSSCTMKGEKPT